MSGSTSRSRSHSFSRPFPLRVGRVPDLHPLHLAHNVGVVFALGHDAFHVLLPGQREELLSVRLDVIAVEHVIVPIGYQRAQFGLSLHQRHVAEILTVDAQHIVPGVLWLERWTIWHGSNKYIAHEQRALLTRKTILPRSHSLRK